MTIGQWLANNTEQLVEAGINTARLDCLVLLADNLDHNKAWLLAHPDTELTNQQHRQLDNQVALRVDHQPLAYIRGFTEFYGRKFIINADVLEPRPESETMIEQFLALQQPPGVVVDVGCGSGALGITAKLERPDWQLVLLDIDPACLAVSRQNLAAHQLQAQLVQSDLLSEITEAADVLLANLPYVPDDFRLNQAAMNEPAQAIFGGADGLNLYRQLYSQLAAARTSKPSHILTESLPKQHHQLAQVAAEAGYRLTAEQDFIQVFKYA